MCKDHAENIALLKAQCCFLEAMKQSKSFQKIQSQMSISCFSKQDISLQKNPDCRSISDYSDPRKLFGLCYDMWKNPPSFSRPQLFSSFSIEPCNATRMLKLLEVPRNLTTKLWELNHFEYSFDSCVTISYILTLFWLTLITHMFFKEGPNFKATQTGLCTQCICFIAFSFHVFLWFILIPLYDTANSISFPSK